MESREGRGIGGDIEEITSHLPNLFSYTGIISIYQRTCSKNLIAIVYEVEQFVLDWFYFLI